MMHDTKKCLNCEGTDHLSGAKNCAARGTPREVDLDEEPNVYVNDPTTSGAHQHPRDPARRGARALTEKHRTPIIIVDNAPSTRPSTPPRQREVTPQGSPLPKRAQVTKTYSGKRTILQVPSSPSADHRTESRLAEYKTSPPPIS